MKYVNILEEEIKNRVTQDFFQKFDCTKILGKIDFAVKIKRPAGAIDFADEYLLWAETKQKPSDVFEMLTQLVLTIGKARTFDEIFPPSFLGCYDNEKIAFIPYADIQEIFYQNDFNWKVAPSNKETREFKQVYAQIEKIINDIPWQTYVFDFDKDEKELKRFISQNFISGNTETAKIRIDKNNFITNIVERQDLLVPQDVRERKGSFFTPKIWVELSQKYLADVLGKDWQDEYYVWDCAAGTGNLLTGLTNKYNIWASTLDKADVDVMKDRIENGANLLESHVFQFDFLNDDFSKLPKGLQEIINDPKRRKKLIVYINPPYAEAGTGLGRKHKEGVASGNKIHIKYSNNLGKARNELFAQFLTRIFFEIPGCKIGEFSTQKALIAPNFATFRKFFFAKLCKGFMVPAETFDNVKGKFPIGFKVWDTDSKKHIESVTLDIYDAKGEYCGKKTYHDGPDCKYINDWFRQYHDKKNTPIGYLHNNKNDFQHNNQVRISSDDIKDHTTPITQNNLIAASVYFSVRKCVEATWLNDRDQFLYPNNGWRSDEEFQNDCLTYTLFSNNIQSKYGTNHWIPFSENEVNSRDKYDSHFMMSFLSGKIIQNGYSDLFEQEEDKIFVKRKFSDSAKKVFDAGRELWRYYHAQPFSTFGGESERRGSYNANVSLYEIREYFQGRNDKGVMNNQSDDETYNELIGNLRTALKTLAKKIEPKVYTYRFLME